MLVNDCSRIKRKTKHCMKSRMVTKANCVVVILITITVINLYVLYQSSLFQRPTEKTKRLKERKIYHLQTTSNFSDDGEDEFRFSRRKERLSTICHSNQAEYDQYMSLCKFSRRTHPMYCTKSIEPGLAGYLIKHNAASIIKNVLYRAMHAGNSSRRTNPYLVDETDFSGLLETDTHNLPFSEFWNLQNITRFTFVRDPFARLLSAYLDSLYISNPLQWRILAKTIRPGDKSACITDITFSEYVEYYLQLIREDKCPERLLLLNYQQVDPCRVKYQYVGKFEHLEKDITHILKEVDMLRTVSFPHFRTDGDAAQITLLVKRIFDNLKDIQACGMTLESAINRMWHRLQVKGILGIYDRPPRGLRDDNKQTTIQTTVMQAYLMGNMYGRDENRGNALREAYSQLSNSTIAELQHVFQLDMELFGYNIYPDYIRSAKDYIRYKSQHFSFFEF